MRFVMRHLEIKRILVPTDLSEKGLVSLQYARFFAERFASALTLMYVDPIAFPATGIGAELPLYTDSTPEHIGAMEKEIRAWADAALFGVPFDVTAVVGQPVPMIVRQEQEGVADLVIMATHGMRGWRRLILGSVTEGVLRGGDRPVLSLNRNERLDTVDPIRKVLCPINFTDVARASLEYASQLTAAVEGELVVVHVVEEEDPMHALAAGMDIRSWIDPAIQNRCTYREIVLRGGAAERVLDCSEDFGADLIVIGAQHKHFRGETVIGTTTERLVRFARMPVLSLPQPLLATKPLTVPVVRAAAGGFACDISN